jgi:alpha-methylacyl-CoA racemase
MLLAFGVLAALFEAQRSGRGQVVDAAMTDGAALLSAMFYGLKAAGAWGGERGANLLDSGAHFYDTYRCADGKYVAVGAIEPQFYAELLQRLGLDPAEFKGQHDARRWPEYKARLAAVFASRSRAEWCARLEGSDACFAPVLDWDEAPRHPHNVARASFVEVDGVVQPAPAPRLQRTPAAAPGAPRPAAADATAVLRDWAARR